MRPLRATHLDLDVLTRVARVAALLSLWMGGVGCVSIDKFATDDEEVFVGQILGADTDDCGDDTSCSFIRRGFSGETQLEMVFDPAQAQTSPGTLSTRNEPCELALTDVPLEPIEALLHDQISLYDFPGAARVRNYIYAVRPPDGPLAGRDGMVFVSLLSDGAIEVRVVVGSGARVCNPNNCAAVNSGACDYYGLFELRRERR